MPDKLKALCLSVGAVTDEQMDALLKSALNYEDAYFLTGRFLIDFECYRAYPVSGIRKMKCRDDRASPFKALEEILCNQAEM